jgi:hypothetical protein
MLCLFAWTTVLAVLGAMLVHAWPDPPYTTDSWSYYELSRHLGTPFFAIDTWRSYQHDAPYGSSFGPLWPVLIRVAGAVTGTGARAGLVAGFGCAVATAGVLTGYARRVGLHPALGPIVVVGLLAFRPYARDLLGGGAAPLALLLVAVLLLLLPGAVRWRAAAAGATAAAAVLTRTDLIVGMALIGGVLLAARRLPWPALVGFLVVLPWVGYSLAHFGTLLVADGTLVAGAAPALGPGWVVDPGAVAMLRDDPAGWLARVAGNGGPMLAAWHAAVPAWPLLVTLLGGLVATVWRRPQGLLLPLIVLPCLLVQSVVGQLGTGHLGGRHLAGAVFIALVLAVGVLLDLGGALGTGIALAGVLAGSVLLNPVPSGPRDSISGGAVEADLGRCHNPAATLLTGPAVGARHGALTGQPTALLPPNLAALDDAELRDWLDLYGIRQLYVPPDVRYRAAFAVALSRIAAIAQVTPEHCAGAGRLYRIEP